ncbi:MAG: DUF6056 family protein [Vicingaceae bacterium]
MRRVNKSQILLLALIVAVIPYLYLCFFTNPSADDFGLSVQLQENNFFDLIYHNYLISNGRYISSSLSVLNPLAFNSFIGYKVVSLFVIISLFFSHYLLISQILTKSKPVVKLLVSFVLPLLFLHNLPIVSEGIYWYTGAIIYTVGLVVSLIYFAAFIKVLSLRLHGVWSAGLTFLLFLSCGFNEVLTLLMVFILGVITFVFYRRNLEGKKRVLLQFTLSVFFLILLMVSPGNAVRGSFYPESKQLVHSLIYSVMQVGRFGLVWVFSLPLIVCSILYIKLHKELCNRYGIFRNSFFLKKHESLFLLFAIIFICVFPAYWATGILGQHRTLNVAFFFFLIFWFINLTVWINSYKNRFSINVNVNFLLLFLVVVICFTGNGLKALQDIYTGDAIAFNNESRLRFVQLRKAKEFQPKQLVLKPINAKPKCLFTYDITKNPKDWKNQAYNMYFRLDSISVMIN